MLSLLYILDRSFHFSKTSEHDGTAFPSHLYPKSINSLINKIRSRLWIIERNNRIFVDKFPIYQLKTIFESDILIMLTTLKCIKHITIHRRQYNTKL